MTKPFTFTITVEVEKQSGKFVSRESLRDELATGLEDADPGDLWIDESEYAVVSWEVSGE